MTATRRWCLVAVGIALLVALVVAVQKRPVSQSRVDAGRLLAQVQGSSSVAYSGYVVSTGALQLPVSDQFTDVADLFGDKTTMRVWWRGADDWRVDKLSATGEVDLAHDRTGTTQWSYESNRATRTPPADIRLPQTSDLLPPELARRLLEDASRGEVTSRPSARVAGVDAAGFRLTPDDAQSSIDKVDIWVDPESGLPLRVDVFGAGNSTAAMSSTFVDVSVRPPSASMTRFAPPPGADVSYDDIVDIAAAANRYAPLVAPPRLAGLVQRRNDLRGVGVYGRGPTLLVAIPLWDRAAVPLREQLGVTPGSTAERFGTSLEVGPLRLLLTPCIVDDHSWLVSGTVTAATLNTAAKQLTTATKAGTLVVPRPDDQR